MSVLAATVRRMMDAVMRWDDASRPVYRRGHVPDGLVTRRQLRDRGLSDTTVRPVAWLYYAYTGHQTCPLFNPGDASPPRAMSPAQADALAAGRELAGTARCGDGLGPTLRREYEACRQRVPRGELWDRRPNGLCEACRLRLDQAYRDVAADWARDVLADKTAVVVDTETTGLDVDDRVVSLCVLHVASGTVLLDTLLHPEVTIPAASTAIHGITDEDVADAPRFRNIAGLLRRLLTGKRVLGWNIAFDQRMIDGELARAGTGGTLSGWAAGVECAMWWHAQWVGGTDGAELVPWPLGGPHDAAGDCRAVVARLSTMATGQPPS